jgi:hypothetical protein
MITVVGAVVATAAWAVKRPGVDRDPKLLSQRVASKRVTRPLLLCVGALNVVKQLYQSPGQRVAGIRTADAKTGADVTLRQVVILVATPVVRDQLLARLTRGLRPPDQPVEDHGPALEELKRVHADDQEAFSEAAMAYHREHRRASSWPQALAQPLAQASLRFLIEAPVRRRWPERSLGEVLAGAAVVVDR